MRVHTLGFLISLAITISQCMASAGSSVKFSKRDADFESVRTRLSKSTVKDDPKHPDKYFHESTISSHYDGRFAAKALAAQERETHLRALLRTYLSCMNDIGVETFIMHGTLLGWWWNRKIMPWDSDVDVVVTETSIHHMAAYYNMTVHRYKLYSFDAGRNYLLEVNPHYHNRSTDPSNHIDARWIDTDTGLFIDITAIRHNGSALAQGLDDMLMIKDNHHYAYDDIFPLRDSVLEDTPVKIPFAYSEILTEEYGEESLSLAYFKRYRFDRQEKLWVPRRRPIT